MLYGWLADAVVVLHLAFIVFVVGGGLLAWYRPWWAWVHLPAMAWGAYVTLAGRPCPLTPLEQALRRRAGEASYEGDFVEAYLIPIVYAGDLGPGMQMGLGVALLLFNVIVYAAVWRGAPHGRDTRPLGRG
jgi:hypothetical protein